MSVNEATLGQENVEVSTGYLPRPLQAEIHRRMKRFNVLVCHRRFGKTVLCVNDLIDQALRETLENPRFAYIAPFYGQAKQVAWDYLKTYARNIPGMKANETELRVEFPARQGVARIRLFGADNYDNLRGIYLDGAVLDEYAQMAPKAWSEVIRPALADRQGTATFIGTPKGRNEFWRMYDGATNGWLQPDGGRIRDPNWYSAIYRASETGIVPEVELAAARSQMTPEEYEQEFECSFDAAILGAYFTREFAAIDKESRLTSVPYSPGHLVHTAWDLGIDDSTAIWFFQIVGREIRLIDYLESNGVGLDWYAKKLREKPYAFGTAILPHDAGSDQLTTGKSIAATLGELGIKNHVLERGDIENGINEARKLMPRCWFDKAKTETGVEALRQYHRDFDEKLKVFKPRPMHDWSSHAADAFRYLAVGLHFVPASGSQTFNRKLEYGPLGNW